MCVKSKIKNRKIEKSKNQKIKKDEMKSTAQSAVEGAGDGGGCGDGVRSRWKPDELCADGWPVAASNGGQGPGESCVHWPLESAAVRLRNGGTRRVLRRRPARGPLHRAGPSFTPPVPPPSFSVQFSLFLNSFISPLNSI